MLLMSMRVSGGPACEAAGRARPRSASVVAAAATLAARSRSNAIQVNRETFMTTPPWVRRPRSMSEIRPHAEADRARDAEQVGALRGQRVGALRVDALAVQPVRHGPAGLGIEEAGRVGRARALVHDQRIVRV